MSLDNSILLQNIRSNDNTLQEIVLSKEKLTVQDVIILSQSLQNNTYIKKINLSHCNLNDEKLKILCKGIKQSKIPLTNLEIVEEPSSDITAVSETLITDTLEFKFTNYGKALEDYEQAATNGNIEAQDCANYLYEAYINILPSSFLSLLPKTLNECHTLQKLDFYDSNENNIFRLNKWQFKILCVILARCSSLQTLNFRRNGFSNLDEGQFKILCESLANCTSLQTLDLSENRIGYLNERPFRILCESLAQYTSLKTLELWGNALNCLNEGQFKILCENLAYCTFLQTLNLSLNFGWSEGFYYEFDRCNLNERQLKILCEGLANCTSLQTLDLSGNNLSKSNEEQFKILCEGLANCTSLQTLDLSQNGFNNLDKGQLEILYTAMKKCKKLRKIPIDDSFDKDFIATYNNNLEEEEQQIKKFLSYYNSPNSKGLQILPADIFGIELEIGKLYIRKNESVPGLKYKIINTHENIKEGIITLEDLPSTEAKSLLLASINDDQTLNLEKIKEIFPDILKIILERNHITLRFITSTS
jgi:Ran GTPase-activating protein (RanGAP) involved in mRNA processing and transport